MGVVGVQTVGRRGSKAARTSVIGLKRGGLYAILLFSLALCLAGYVLVNEIGHTKLIQVALALIVLGLLRGWISLNRSALTTESAGTTVSTPPFSLIRVPLSRRGRAVHPQPAPESPHGADQPLIGDPVTHISLR